MLFNLKFLSFVATLSILFASCQPNNNNPIASCDYFPYNTNGSEFIYTTTNNNGTDTITETVLGDTTINGYACKIIEQTTTASSSNPSRYYSYCGPSGYMQRNFFIPGYNVVVDSLVYLKDNLSAGDMWVNTFSGTFNNFNVTVDYENFYENIEPTRVVNGETFNNVIQIRLDLYTTISSFGGRQFSGSFNYYFAEGVGLIENSANNTKLISYTIAP